MFGASDPALRNSPTGTAVLWDAFSELAKVGVKKIDLEGVNSPKRGWFKLSFFAGRGSFCLNFFFGFLLPSRSCSSIRVVAVACGALCVEDTTKGRLR